MIDPLGCIMRVTQISAFIFSRLSTKPSRYLGVSSCHFVQYRYKAYLWATLGLNMANIGAVVITCALANHYRKQAAGRVSKTNLSSFR